MMFSIPDRTKQKIRGRRGYGMFELVLAMILLMVASNATVKIIGWVAAERRTAERQLLARQILANAMEQLSSVDYQTLTPEYAQAQLKAIEKSKTLAEAEWNVDIAEVTDPKPSAKRIHLSVRWKTRSGEWIKSIQLTSWIFPGSPTS